MMTPPSRFRRLSTSALLSAGFIAAAVCAQAQSVFIDFDTAADYDSNFYETAKSGFLGWNSAEGGYLRRTGEQSASVAIYNSHASGATVAGSGGTVGGTPLDTFENFTVQADVSVSGFSATNSALGFYTKLNDTATAGYLTIFRITNSSISVVFFDSNGNATTSAPGTSLFEDTIEGAFAVNTYYTLSVGVQDLGEKVHFTASVFKAGTTDQIGSSVTFTDTTNAATGFGQIGIRLGNSSPSHVVKMDNFSVIPEPSTYAMLGGAAALGLAVVYRHRRRA